MEIPPNHAWMAFRRQPGHGIKGLNVYKRILAAVDFSDINLLAVKRATLLAKRDNCLLILLHVIEHYRTGSGPLDSELQDGRHDNALVQDVRGKLDSLKSTIDYQNVQTEFSITSKSARNEILRFAKAHEVDLIVIAPHGHGIIGSLGSTATGILISASCDVLAVRDSDD